MSVFGETTAGTFGKVTPTETQKQDDCWVKITVKAGDVAGSVANEGSVGDPNYMLRLKFKMDVNVKCQCFECDEYDPGPWGHPTGEDSSFEWKGSLYAGSFSGNTPKPPCSNNPDTGDGTRTGTLANGFTWIKCRETDDPCDVGTNDEGQEFFFCEGEHNLSGIEKEITQTLGSYGPTKFCDIKTSDITTWIQEALENQVNALPDSHSFFQCNKKEEKPKDRSVTAF